MKIISLEVFEKGDLVVVVDDGEIFSTYRDCAKYFRVENFAECKRVIQSGIYTVVKAVAHGDNADIFKPYGLLYFIENKIGERFLISEKGLKLFEVDLA